MRKLIIALAAGAVVACSAGAAGAATGYHSDMTFVIPSGDGGSCLTAASAEDGAEVYVFGCEPGDALQTWTALAIGGVTLIALSAHPDLVIGGIPGQGNGVHIIRVPSGQDVPLPQTTYISGNMTAAPDVSSNKVTNTAGEYLTLPSAGHKVVWARRGLSTLKWTRSWLFVKGWVRETSV